MAMIESVDHEIGRVLSAMDATQRENTLIFFVGDNGTPNSVLQAFPNRRGKGSLYQGGLHVPMIVSGHSVRRAGEREASPVHVLDVYATVLEAVGLEMEGGVNNSFSFLKLLSDGDAEKRPYVISEGFMDGAQAFAIRNDRYKLIETQAGDQQLFDLMTDSFEQNDLTPTGLTAELEAVLNELSDEGRSQTSGWSCNDGILNGAEMPGSCSGLSTSTQYVDPLGPILRLTSAPNPFSSSAIISFEIRSSEQPVKLEIFDVLGRRVRTMNQGWTGPGLHQVRWNGLEESGEESAPGLYLYRVSSGSHVETNTMVRIQ